eukprot:4687825-Pleurochrysis_carterae.AAC.1
MRTSKKEALVTAAGLSFAEGVHRLNTSDSPTAADQFKKRHLRALRTASPKSIQSQVRAITC